MGENEVVTMLELREKPALQTPTNLSETGADEIAIELRQLLADVFVLYVETKNFHWRMSGRHFRDYHLLLDEQAQQILAKTDNIAQRARKISGTNIRSSGDISRNQRLHDDNYDFVAPHEMLADLIADNQRLTRSQVRRTRPAYEITMSPSPV